MTPKIYNFGAGPAMLPAPVLEAAQKEFLNWHNLGVSILETGHRTPEFIELLTHAEQTLRELVGIPDNYRVLFLGGAARTQFAMIPLNLLHPDEQAGYLVTGLWSKLAYEEACKLKQAYALWRPEQDVFTQIPATGRFSLRENTRYVYYTPNETVDGIRMPYIPDSGGLPLIADMTSCLLTEPLDIKKYALIFAGAQKNIANAGLTLVIIRDDLYARMPEPVVPSMLDYTIHAEQRSLYATPPVFNCYLAAKMFDWVKANGGVEAFFRTNCLKAAKLYQYLDASAFYCTKVEPDARSLVNVCFSLRNSALEPLFIEQAAQQGLYALKGHRIVGGLRASLYNAMPMSGVDALIEFMTQFAKEHS